jgi:ATP-dependent Clp protease ATP-binding subunit ClpA
VLDHFTDEARRAVVLAAEEARVLGHDRIGTEHLLLGLVHLNDAATDRLDMTLTGARASVRELVGTGGGRRTIGELQFTRVAKEALDRADTMGGAGGAGPRELLAALRTQAGSGAAQLIDDQTDDGEQLLAVFDDPDSVAARALLRLGVDEMRLRRALEYVRAEG